MLERIFEIIKNVISILYKILMIIIVCLSLILGIYFIQTKIMKKNYANIFGITFFEVSTGSMVPTMRIGDLIIVKINDNYEINDVIVYKENDSLITHRVIEIKEDTIITKGDANNTEDNQIRKDAVIGKVIKIIPKVAQLKKIVLMPQVIFPTIIIILLLGILIWLKI